MVFVNEFDFRIHALLVADAVGMVVVEMTMTLHDLVFASHFVNVMREKVKDYLYHVVNNILLDIKNSRI